MGTVGAHGRRLDRVTHSRDSETFSEPYAEALEAALESVRSSRLQVKASQHRSSSPSQPLVLHFPWGVEVLRPVLGRYHPRNLSGRGQKYLRWLLDRVTQDPTTEGSIPRETECISQNGRMTPPRRRRRSFRPLDVRLIQLLTGQRSQAWHSTGET